MIYLQDFKKKKQPRVLLHLGSSQHSHAPEAWAGLRETLEGVPVIVRPRSHWGGKLGYAGCRFHPRLGVQQGPQPHPSTRCPCPGSGGMRSWRGLGFAWRLSVVGSGT